MLHGGCDDDASAGIYETYGTHTKLQKMVDLEGNAVATDVDLDRDQIVQDVNFAREEPDDEDFQGHTGNAGAEKTLWYRKAVLVVMPKSRWISFIAKRVIEGSASAVDTTKQLLESFKEDTSNLLARSNLQTFCEKVVAEMIDGTSNQTRHLSFMRYRATAGGKYSPEFKVMLISCGVWLVDEKICEKVMSTMEGNVPSDMFNNLRVPLMAKFANSRQLLLDAFCQMGTIAGVWKCLQDFMGADCQEPELKAWSALVLTRVLQTTTEMTAADALSLMAMSVWYGADFHNICIVPCALKHASQAWFSLAFAKELFDHAQSETSSGSLDGNKLRLDAINIVVAPHAPGSDFQIARLGEPARSRSYNPYTRWSSFAPDLAQETDGIDSDGTPLLHFADPTMLVQLYHYLTAVEQLATLKPLLTEIIKSAHRLGSKIALLSSARNDAGPYEDAINGGIYATFSALWKRILLYYVGAMPANATQSMRHVSCSCRDCAHLNRFLADAQQTQLKFPASKQRRQHLHNMLDRHHAGEITHETQRIGNPQSLIVTKRPGARAKRERIMWTSKAANVKELLLSIPEEELKKALNADFLEFLPEASMRAMFGESWGSLTLLLRNPLSTTLVPNGQSDSDAEVQQRVLEIAQQHVQMAMQAGGGAPSLIPAKRKAEIDIVDLTED